MALFELPLKFENPLLGVFGIVVGVVFLILFYFSHKRLRMAEKRLELVEWKTVRKVTNFVNVGMKIGMVVALSLLLAIPYFPTTLEVPIEELSEELLAQSSVTVMLVMDVSYSMNYSDLKPSRLQVAKQMAKLLCNNLSSSDLVGFMSFAGKIYDKTLPTLDKSAIADLIDNQTVYPSTAMGTALEAALGALEVYQGGRAIVLFSDGKNNAGVMDLASVAEMAAGMKIPLFTVFVGTYGIGEADPLVLEDMSSVTGGIFYGVKSDEMKALATDVLTISHEVKTGALEAAFDTITFDARDYHYPMVIFAALLVISLFLTWFTGV